MLKINIKTTNINLDQHLRDFIYKKINSLEKFIKIDKDIEVWLEIGKPSQHHQKGPEFYAEATAYLPGKVIRVEARKEDLMIAINEIKDDLQRQLKGYKEKQETKYKRGARKAKRLIKLSPLVWFKRKKGFREREEGI